MTAWVGRALVRRPRRKVIMFFSLLRSNRPNDPWRNRNHGWKTSDNRLGEPGKVDLPRSPAKRQNVFRVVQGTLVPDQVAESQSRVLRNGCNKESRGRDCEKSRPDLARRNRTRQNPCPAEDMARPF